MNINPPKWGGSLLRFEGNKDWLWEHAKLEAPTAQRGWISECLGYFLKLASWKLKKINVVMVYAQRKGLW